MLGSEEAVVQPIAAQGISTRRSLTQTVSFTMGIFKKSDEKDPEKNHTVVRTESSSLSEKSKAKDDTDSEEEQYAGLDDTKKEILKRQTQTPDTVVTFMTLFRYADKFDFCLILLGMVMAAAAGVCLPIFTIIFGSMTNEFTNFFVYGASKEHFQSRINHFALYFVYLAVATFGTTAIKTYITVERGERLTARIRANYLKAILRQNIGYFDKLGAGEVTNRITSDTNLIQEGISEKLGLIVSAIASFITALVIGFIKQAKLTGIMLSTVFALALSMGICSTFLVKYTKLALEDDSACSSIAEEAFSSIRNIVAFGSQSRMVEKYNVPLASSLHNYLRKNISLAVMVGCLWSLIYIKYALALWEGSRLVAWGETEVGNVTTVLMALMIGAFELGGVAPNLESVGVAIASGKKIFGTIDRVPEIDSQAGGETIADIKGHIVFDNVDFRYPSRPKVQILEDFNLEVKPGQTVALVGASGSGKSTLIGLLERFYQPLSGLITIDGVNLLDLDVKWLRQHISLVSQEPTLFNVTIYENITYGLIGTQWEHADDAKKMELVEYACRQANAWDFVQLLTDGIHTNVGESGMLLSGGQKQRIAIARAIISNPPILLLDEATSALDTKSEGIVQEALDKASENRTTIVIAHRLSTIKNASNIVVMSKGEIIEQGTHAELIAKQGMYYGLVDAQKLTEARPGHKGSDDAPLVIQEDDMMKKVNTNKSLSSQILANKEKPDRDKHLSVAGMVKLLAKYNKNERPFLYVGGFAALINGAGYPALALLFASAMQAFMVGPDMYHWMRHEMNKYSGFLFMVGMIELLAYFVQIYCLGWCSEHLVRNIRHAVFTHLLRMDVAFHDEDENTTGSLTSTLSKDAQYVQGLGGATFGQILSSLCTIVIGVIIAICYTWRLGLVCTACVPLIIGCGFFRFWILTHLNLRGKKVYEQSASYACEATTSIRTVVTLTREDYVYNDYLHKVESQVADSARANVYSAILYSISQSLNLLISALGFWYGSTLMKDGIIDTNKFFVAFVSVVFGCQSAGSIFSFTPDMGKAKTATQNIANMLAVLPELDVDSEEGLVLDHETVRGDITFEDVRFRYPTRPQVPILRGLNLNIKKGQYVALVGSSGCGKSTTIALIERFYDVLSGSVKLDGIDIRDININSYRSCISLVQQEPVLFSGTVRENILLGSPRDDVTEEEMIEAAQMANIHSFVMSLPDGYDTYCGSKGSLLSGGQKQRVAIARALIRNPKILLLDEATSALDSESEKIVQAALDQAAKGRTTIAVAHRLSTIQNADIIYVFEEGRVLEAGTHQELLANKSKYYELVKLQALEG